MKVSPYQLFCGHEAVLPWEIKTGSRRVSLQEKLMADDYKDLMNSELEDLTCHRLRVLESIEANKLKIAKNYDKKVKLKEFHEGDLVWKLILPICSKDSKYEKWSPNWEGPYRINHCIPCNAYIIEMLEGEKFRKALNRKYLKKYYPSIWVDS